MNKWIKYNQLWQLTVALFREIIREPGVLFWGILFPILMSLGLGLAFTKKADVVRKVAIIKSAEITSYDFDRPSVLIDFLLLNSRKTSDTENKEYQWELVLRDDKLGNSIFYFYEMDWSQAMMYLKRGTINLIVFENDGETEYHFDPLNSDAQLTYIKLNNIIGEGKVMPSESNQNIKPLTVTGTRYIDFLIPGLITMGIMMSCMWGISYGLIEKRSKKLLRRLVATPMRKSHFLVALITVRIGMNFIESIILFVFAVLVFKMTIQGDISALILVFLAGNIAFAGIAIFVSSHTSNTEVGNGLINAVVFPLMILSGIFFSYHNFPDWSIKVIQVLPLTVLTDGIRSIFNEGAGYKEAAVPILILIATGVIFFAAGLKIFKWH
ncbi:MAG TPA: ABC transporter permease [Bacteroidales bacterium]|nr:ABC transporter permease [Bacteroidales bacterium]